MAHYPRTNFQVNWHPYFIMEALPEEGITLKEYCQRQLPPEYSYDIPYEEICEVMQPVVEVASKVGIVFKHPKDDRIFPTLHAHRLVEFAKRYDEARGNSSYFSNMQTKVVETLHQWYFEQTRNVGKIDVLVEAARSVGLDDEEVRKYLETDEDVASVKRHYQDAKARGVNDVPHFTIRSDMSKEKIELEKATPEEFLEALEKLLGVPPLESPELPRYYCMHEVEAKARDPEQQEGS